MRYITLTELELRRASLVAKSMTYKEIGESEYVTPETVKTTLINVFRKLGVSNSMQMIVELLRRKLLVWDKDRRYIVTNTSMYPYLKARQI